MKLIDVEKITDEEIIDYLGSRHASCAEDVRNLLADQPIAFNLEAVVRELEANQEGFFIRDHMFVKTIPLDKAIEIVKRGGRNV